MDRQVPKALPTWTGKCHRHCLLGLAGPQALPTWTGGSPRHCLRDAYMDRQVP